MAASLTDAAGTQHRPAGADMRIVSLVPSLTECLCALGLRQQLVGRTRYCVHPAGAVADIPVVGGTKDVDLGKVRALAPTHAVLNVDENTRETARALREFVPHLVVTHPLAPRDNLALFELLGRIFRRDGEAGALASALRAELAALADVDSLPVQRVLYLIWRKPWMTVSRNTYISRMLSLVNWQTWPAETASRYPAVTLEEARGQVDLALLSSEPYPFGERHLPLVSGPLGSGTRALLVQGDMLSWYGSRAIAGIAYLRELAQRISDARDQRNCTPAPEPGVPT
jgi:ABC-type Fe3+-hydroxamate transport system substrate-binding protein